MRKTIPSYCTRRPAVLISIPVTKLTETASCTRRLAVRDGQLYETASPPAPVRLTRRDDHADRL